VVDPNTFIDSPGLISLNLRGNSKLEGPSYPESPFLKSRSLHTLDLAECGITHIGEGFFTALPSLRKIDLSGNDLATIDAGTFSTLTGLDELHLSHTKITHLSPAFSFDAPLHTLDLSGTKLGSSDLTPLLARLPHLENLNLRKADMALTTVQHASAFNPAKWLQHLNLEGNNLGGLDMTQALGKLRNLESLDLSYCSLNSESFGSDALSNLTRLRVLNLSGNILSSLNMTALMEAFSKLHTLVLRNCNLGTTEFLRELKPLRHSLRSLDLADNPLGNDQVNAAGSIFPHLESLDVSRCQITQVANTAFSSATNLVNLAISGNQFTQLEDGALSSLTQLQILHMENCGILGAPAANVFPSGTEAPLRELRMAGNPLKPESTPLIPRYLSGLTLLDISRSGIRHLPASAIRGARNLEKLIMTDNLLQGEDALPANLASLVPNLHKIDLRRSKMQSLNPAIFSGNEKLTKVYLTGNPWRCDCQLEELWRWATSKGIVLQEKGGEDTLRCADSENMWSTTFDSLNCA
jgi:Leucine-rich repeat (LRR) protein